MSAQQPVRTIIMGAAGRDFHNFNVVYRDDPDTDVIAFTAAQIPGIDARRYPAALAGVRYPNGIAIEPEHALEKVLRDYHVQRVVFAYSDLAHEEVMHRASRALACGADFVMLGPTRTMLRAQRPVIAISAVRTGCGKSQVARWIARWLRTNGVRVAVIRHPMPYGDLTAQAVQRFASRSDLDTAHCTLEEREEYEPHLAIGNIVYAGVDYERILRLAEAEADVILWDGGNNDFPFIRPDWHLVLVDPLRPGHETRFHPGETVLRMADTVIITKTDTADVESVDAVIDAVRRANPTATIVQGASPITLDTPELVRGRRVLVVEDGPTITHGGMPYGAGFIAAQRAGAATIVNPRDYLDATATPPDSLAAVYRAYPHIGAVLPATGYNDAQRAALTALIQRAPIDVVVAATPIDLAQSLSLDVPVVRARYEFAEKTPDELTSLLRRFLPVDRSAERRKAPTELDG